MTTKQKAVVLSMLVGLTATLLLFVGVTINFELIAPHGRAILLAEALVVPAIFLVACIGRMATHRFVTPEDIDGDPRKFDSPKAFELQRILQNTLEQSVLAALVYLIWSVIAPDHWLGVLPIAVMLFAIGRILFFAFHGRGAAGRAIGFALTFYPTVAMLLIEIKLAFT